MDLTQASVGPVTDYVQRSVIGKLVAPVYGVQLYILAVSLM